MAAEDPVIGRAPAYDNLVAACVTSFGFALSPATRQTVAGTNRPVRANEPQRRDMSHEKGNAAHG
jgi:hypothetical protein